MLKTSTNRIVLLGLCFLLSGCDVPANVNTSSDTIKNEECFHIDSNNDHLCDKCNEKISDHNDVNNDHKCDTCNTTITAHEDKNNDHNCDICGEKITNHVDNDNNHYCDTCNQKLSGHIDANSDGYCDTCSEFIGLPEKKYAVVYGNSSPAWNYLATNELEKVSENSTMYYIDISVSIGIEIKLSDKTNLYTNWILTGEDNAYLKGYFTVLSGNAARFNVYGTFTIYFETGDTNPGITIKSKTVTSKYYTHETLGSVSGPYLLSIDKNLCDQNKLVYKRSGQTYATNQIIQIKLDGVLQHFTLSANSIKNKFNWYDEANYSYIRVPNKIDEDCIIYLYVSTSDLSLIVEIVYQK